MHAYKTKAKLTKSVDFSFKDDDDDSMEIHYWRKHPNLHGWMEQLYYNKGGQSDSFNCVNVELNTDDLLDLKSAIESNELPHTSGFFFGETSGTERDDDLEFVETALKSINEGYSVYYSSWW